MREDDNNVAPTLLRAFEAVVAGIAEQQAAAATNHRWQFAPGTHVHPEGRCPYCNATIRTTDIYVVPGAGTLAAQYRMVDGRLVRLREFNHPHVDRGSGHICTGRSASNAEALFLGMNPNSPLNGSFMESRQWHAWLVERWGHTCPNAGLPSIRVARPATTARRAELWTYPDRPTERCLCGCECIPAIGPCGCGCSDCLCDRDY